MDIKLNADHDIDFTGGRMSFVRDADAVLQNILIRLRFQLGEYFGNRLAGIPIRQLVLVKDPQLGALREIYRKVITTTPGVLRLEDLQLSLEAATRTLSMAFSAKLVEVVPGTTNTLPTLDYSGEFVL